MDFRTGCEQIHGETGTCSDHRVLAFETRVTRKQRVRSHSSQRLPVWLLWTPFLQPWETESDAVRTFQKLRLPSALDVFEPRFLIAAVLLETER